MVRAVRTRVMIALATAVTTQTLMMMTNFENVFGERRLNLSEKHENVRSKVSNNYRMENIISSNRIG